jgi:hypothetical protein
MATIVRFGLGLLLFCAVGTAVADETKTAAGKVTAVAADSLSIQKGNETLTFVVDSATKFVGKGLTTKTQELKAQGKAMTLIDAVGKDDRVVVKYDEKDGKMHAVEVKVDQKALMAK